MKEYTLRKGDRGQEVRKLQVCLPGITIDSDFGPKTEKAVKEYQARFGLVSDGIAGTKTLECMGIPVYAGIDIYNGNGVIDWKKVAEDGVKFAWIKCSEGTTFKDKSRLKNLTGARKAGLITGAYHFGRPDNGPKANMQDAKDEAHNFLKAYKSVCCGDLSPVLDLEAGHKTDDSYNAEWAITWIKEVEKEIGRPVVYCAKWATDLYLKNAVTSLLDELKKYPIWWAGYNTGIEPKHGVDIWTEWDVWQWTGSGKTAGVAGKCDKNWASGGRLNNLRIG